MQSSLAIGRNAICEAVGVKNKTVDEAIRHRPRPAPIGTAHYDARETLQQATDAVRAR